MDAFLQDLRYGIRGLIRDPAFAFLTVLCLAWGSPSIVGFLATVQRCRPRAGVVRGFSRLDAGKRLDTPEAFQLSSGFSWLRASLTLAQRGTYDARSSKILWRRA